jgi:alkanesulfonate monooxygenase SsuD/methylene tetrahydromethanopterin reductase-like flavin-dependent oxidoreductase (luciferase family)
MSMRIGLDIAQQRMPWSEIAARASFADDAGFDGIWGFDHFQPMYGDGPGECFEGYATLAALSGTTRRARLGLLVSGVTYRPPALLASEAITIDHASGGRLNLSLGAAWFGDEHHSLGFPFPPTATRIEMLDEALQIIRGLFTTEGFTFEGQHYQVHDATLLPRPVQSPYPPIWIGAMGERKMLPLAARYADVWHAYGSLEELVHKSRLLDEMAVQANRDPSEISRAGSVSLDQPLDDVRRFIDEHAAAGFSHLIAGWPSTGQPTVEAFATKVLPDLTN